MSQDTNSRALRYAVECDTADRGRSTYAECWGSGAARGRTLYETDDLIRAVQFCDGNPSLSTGAITPWIWDRRKHRVVTNFVGV